MAGPGQPQTCSHPIIALKSEQTQAKHFAPQWPIQELYVVALLPSYTTHRDVSGL